MAGDAIIQSQRQSGNTRRRGERYGLRMRVSETVAREKEKKNEERVFPKRRDRTPDCTGSRKEDKRQIIVR